MKYVQYAALLLFGICLGSLMVATIYDRTAASAECRDMEQFYGEESKWVSCPHKDQVMVTKPYGYVVKGETIIRHPYLWVSCVCKPNVESSMIEVPENDYPTPESLEKSLRGEKDAGK